MPLWMVATYMKMLGPLTAGRQLLAIEAASVPRMKADAATQVISRYRRRYSREKPKSVAEQLMASMKVKLVPKQQKEPDER